VVKYLKGRNTLISDLGGDSNVESDCEDDSTGSASEALETTEEHGEEARAVLVTGSFSAYAFFRLVLTLK